MYSSSSVGDSPTKATRADCARAAVTSAVASWVTPGPQVAVHTPGVVGDARPAVGHAQAGAFVAHLEKLHAQVVQGLHPVHVAVAHHAEDGRRAFGDECLGQTLVDLHTGRCYPPRGCPPLAAQELVPLRAAGLVDPCADERRPVAGVEGVGQGAAEILQALDVDAAAAEGVGDLRARDARAVERQPAAGSDAAAWSRSGRARRPSRRRRSVRCPARRRR